MAMSLELNLRILRAVLVLMGIGVGAYILGPPLYWHVAEALARNAADCADEPDLLTRDRQLAVGSRPTAHAAGRFRIA